jgi:hypothetical protein
MAPSTQFFFLKVAKVSWGRRLIMRERVCRDEQRDGARDVRVLQREEVKEDTNFELKLEFSKVLWG